jgi:phospholipase C
MRKLALLCFAFGCSTSEAPTYTGPRSTLDENGAIAARQACMFKAGDPPGISVEKTAKLGSQIPIDTIVVVMMENRSFDHLFSNLPAFGQPDVDVADASKSNPDSQGNAVPFHHEDSLCFSDTNHEWNGSHAEYDDGKNDGFVIANENFEGGPADGVRAMGYYDEREVPFIYSLANSFAISDRYFCSVTGPTFVNREYLYAGTSYGWTRNQIISEHENNIMETLELAGVDWRVYSETLPGPAIFLDTYTKYIGDKFLRFDYFADDAAAGKLAPVTFVDPNLRDDGAIRDDFHPPGDLQLGDQFLYKVVSAIASGPQWSHTAIFVTWDEHGGLYDHVPPPQACPPGDRDPILDGADNSVMAKFDHLGFRVPLIVVSPYAKKHYVSHRVYDHTSILRFIEARFGLGALTNRDANADPLFDLFEFGTALFPKAPAMTEPTVDQKKLDDCVAQYPKGDGGIPGLNPDMM